MSIFRTQNPWLLAAGAGQDVGRTYASSLVDMARIRAAQKESAEQQAWRDQVWQQQQAQTQQEMALRRRDAALREQLMRRQLLQEELGQKALSPFLEQVNTLSQPGSPVGPTGPVLPQPGMPVDQAALRAMQTVPDSSYINPTMLKFITDSAKNAARAQGQNQGDFTFAPIGKSGLYGGMSPTGGFISGTLARQTPEGSYKLLSEEVPPLDIARLLNKGIAGTDTMFGTPEQLAQMQRMLQAQNEVLSRIVPGWTNSQAVTGLSPDAEAVYRQYAPK
jgi:hypothetical protein